MSKIFKLAHKLKTKYANEDEEYGSSEWANMANEMEESDAESQRQLQLTKELEDPDYEPAPQYQSGKTLKVDLDLLKDLGNFLYDLKWSAEQTAPFAINKFIKRNKNLVYNLSHEINFVLLNR